MRSTVTAGGRATTATLLPGARVPSWASRAELRERFFFQIWLAMYVLK